MGLELQDEPIVFFFFFFPLLLFSCPGKVNTHPPCSCCSYGNCWTVCAPLVVLLPGLSCKRQGRQVSISGWAHCKQMHWKNGKESREYSWVHTHTHTCRIVVLSHHRRLPWLMFVSWRLNQTLNLHRKRIHFITIWWFKFSRLTFHTMWGLKHVCMVTTQVTHAHKRNDFKIIKPKEDKNH